MKPAPFSYYRPADLAEALQCLDAQPGAKVLAGGQSLLPLMNRRLVRPSHLVDISRLDELSGLSVEGDHVLVGGACIQRRVELDARVRRSLALLSAAISHVNHVSVRNRGTLGGSLAHADPGAEIPAVLTALDGVVHVESRNGRRAIAASEFILAANTTVMAYNEIITAIVLPTRNASAGWGFAEVSRRHGDPAMAGAAVTVRTSRAGSLVARCVLFGVIGRPILVEAVTDMPVSSPGIADQPATSRAVDAIVDAIEPSLHESDMQASDPLRWRYARSCAAKAARHALARWAASPQALR